MAGSSQKPRISAINVRTWAIENDRLEAVVSVGTDGVPSISRFVDRSLPDVDWGTGLPLAPVVEFEGQAYRPGSGGFVFSGAEVDGENQELRLIYRLSHRLEVHHYLAPSPDKAVLRFRTALIAGGARRVEGVSRFDALNLNMTAGRSTPLAAYLLGWLEGPRADGPGRPPIPFPYDLWIPRLLYGDGAPSPPPPPPGGWASPVFRLITEPLSRLLLRSGKRSTYDNHPWLTVLDPRRQAGFFLGFEWSGTWRIVAEHLPGPGALSVSVRTDATVHTIEPGARLESPAAFLGLFSGDWDDGFNACRRYVGSEVIPAPPEGFPPVRYNIGTPRLPRFTPSFLKAGIDAAAEAGVENLTIDAMRWDASADDGDFSIGLGDFADSRKKFPAGLRAVSDLVHERGIRQGKVGCRGWPHARSSHSR